MSFQLLTTPTKRRNAKRADIFVPWQPASSKNISLSLVAVEAQNSSKAFFRPPMNCLRIAPRLQQIDVDVDRYVVPLNLHCNIALLDKKIERKSKKHHEASWHYPAIRQRMLNQKKTMKRHIMMERFQWYRATPKSIANQPWRASNNFDNQNFSLVPRSQRQYSPSGFLDTCKDSNLLAYFDTRP